MQELTRAGCLVEHVAKPRSGAVPAEIIDAVLRELVPSNNRRAITELFDNRVTFFAVRHWRKGRRRAPQWAIEILQQKISAANSRRLELETKLRSG